MLQVGNQRVKSMQSQGTREVFQLLTLKILWLSFKLMEKSHYLQYVNALKEPY